jgi:sterol desaturase/sphingolipid hydroxylase (fatty acid hydroxylase superfamily)
MLSELFEPMSAEALGSLAKRLLPIVLLAIFWSWETWRPLFGQRTGRWQHALVNLALALFNTVILGLVFGTATVAVARWAKEDGLGILHAADLPTWASWMLALVLLDGWMYLWHFANHSMPILWRFHRVHHSDLHMDVTTATRFHLGEHLGAATLRLGLIPLVGFELWHLIVYDALVIAVTQFHHADISLGRLDAWLRWLVVTPDMHKVHHSNEPRETDSNFSTVLSVWDRLAGTLVLRPNVRGIVFGLKEFQDGAWQSAWGLLRMPFTRPPGRSRIPKKSGSAARVLASSATNTP